MGSLDIEPRPKPAFPLLALLALASALGVAVAVALAAVAMLLAAPAYADDGGLMLERRGGLAQAALLFAKASRRKKVTCGWSRPTRTRSTKR